MSLKKIIIRAYKISKVIDKEDNDRIDSKYVKMYKYLTSNDK